MNDAIAVRNDNIDARRRLEESNGR